MRIDLDDEHRTAGLVRDGVRDAPEEPALHALVPDDENVGARLVGELHQHVRRVSFADHRAAVDPLLTQALRGPRHDLPDPRCGARRPLKLDNVARRVGRSLSQLAKRAEEHQLALEPPRELRGHLHRFGGRGGAVQAHGDGGDRHRNEYLRSGARCPCNSGNSALKRARRLLVRVGQARRLVASKRSWSRSFSWLSPSTRRRRRASRR